MIRTWLVIAITATHVAACAGESAPPPPETGAAPSPATRQQGDPDAADLWERIRADDYRSWALWPGTTARYEGTEPHGMLLTTYVNETARRALEAGTLPLPDGAIIVKENYMPDGTYDAATVMLKREGYAPDHNDWFWAKYDGAGTAEVAGRVDMCQACHGASRHRDHLMTPIPGAGG
jgi:hypothetical protein